MVDVRVFHPLGWLAICAVLSGCGPSRDPLPEIAQALPSNVVQASEAFDARVQEQFPIGTEEFELVQALVSDGFELREGDDRVAVFSVSTLVCLETWRIRWEAQRGSITEVGGHYGLTCL